MRDLFEISKSGILTHSKNIEVAGHNISNASTEGYTRQDAVLAANSYYDRHGDQIGLGVNVTEIRRMRNSLLDDQIRQRNNILMNLEGKHEIYTKVQNVLSTDTDNDLDKSLNNFFDTFSYLSANPESYNLRQDVVREAQNLVDQFHRIDGELDTLQELVAKDTDQITTEINRLIKDISSLDNAIVANSNDNRQSDLRSLDVRDQKLKDLGELVDLDYNYDENDSITLRIGGIVVLQNGRYKEISNDVDPANNLNHIKLDSGKKLSAIGGKLGAYIEAYQEIIPGYRDQVDSLAMNLADKMNEIHTQGFGLEDGKRRSFFDIDSNGAGTIKINHEISQNANHIAASSKIDAPGNSDNAILLAKLRNEQNAMGTQGFSEFAISLQQDAGGHVSSLSTQIETTVATKELFESQQEDIAGVSIDEELANILKFQNAYQASAKVLNTAQTMYDTLIAMVR